MSTTPEQKAPSGLAQRLVTGVVLAVFALGIIWLPYIAATRARGPEAPVGADYLTPENIVTIHIWPFWAFALLAAAFVAIGFREYAAMVRQKGIALALTGGTIAVAALVLTAKANNFVLLNAVFFAAVALLSWAHILRGMAYHTLPGLAATIFGVVYLGWMPAHLVLMHQDPVGPGLVTLLIAMVAMSDTGAYFTGRAIGKHKLAPHTSPKKTWEGAAGGLVAAMLTGAIIFALRAQFDMHALPDYPLWWFLVTGAILSVVSQIGDLVESMIKRDAGVKDSGTIFPGHGGVLDRCDGILFAAPALYYLLMLEKGF